MHCYQRVGYLRCILDAGHQVVDSLCEQPKFRCSSGGFVDDRPILADIERLRVRVPLFGGDNGSLDGLHQREEIGGQCANFRIIGREIRRQCGALHRDPVH